MIETASTGLKRTTLGALWRIAGWLVLTVLVWTARPTEASAYDYPVLIRNQCAQPVTGYIRYKSTLLGVRTIWFAVPTTSGLVPVADYGPVGKGAPVRHTDAPGENIFVYAKTQNGAFTLWEGEDVLFTTPGGQQLGLKRYPVEYDPGDDRRGPAFVLVLRCAGVKAIQPTPEQIAAKAAEVLRQKLASYRTAISSCDIHNTQGGISFGASPTYYASLVASIFADDQGRFLKGEFDEWLAAEQGRRRDCLGAAERFVAAEDRADLAARIARSDAELADDVSAARAAVEANPRLYLGAVLDEFDASGVGRAVQTARGPSARAIVQRQCGTPDYSMPHHDNDVLRARRSQADAYLDCLDRLNPAKMHGTLDQAANPNMVKLVAVTKPLTCSKNRGATCIDDERWSRVAEVATVANLRVLQQASTAWAEVLEDISRTACWRLKVDQTVAVANGQTPPPTVAACLNPRWAPL
jgi:hypothetical protein